MDNYIALGDSISISSYPSLDAGLGTQARVGAADLTGAALLKLGHVHEMRNLTADGATTTDVILQLRHLSPKTRNECNIITLTAGGNDISFAGMQHGKKNTFDEWMNCIENRFDALVEHIMDQFPNSILVLNTLYDPTDGTGELPDCGSWSKIADWYSDGRRSLGSHIRKRYGPTATVVGYQNRILFCDIFKMFDGHGMREGNPTARWYYSGFMIEPGSIGAREISAAWLQIIAEFIREQQDRKVEKRISFSH